MLPTSINIINVFRSSSRTERRNSINSEYPQRRHGGSQDLPLITCCLCFSIHQGFITIAYLDISRFFLGLISSVFTYNRSDSINIDYISSSLFLFAIIIQALLAMLSMKRALYRNNYHIYSKYLWAKFLYLLAFLFENILKGVVICEANMRPKDQDNCESGNLSGQTIMYVIWFVLEIYIAIVVFKFYRHSVKGDFGLFGGYPEFGDQTITITTEQRMVFDANPVESKGFNIRDLEDKQTIKTSFPLCEKFNITPAGITFHKRKSLPANEKINHINLIAQDDVLLISVKDLKNENNK